MGNVYTCANPTDIIFNEAFINIDSVSGEHLYGAVKKYQDENVRGMWYEASEDDPFELERLPRGFKKIFSKIVAIGFYSTNINQISQKDVIEYGNQLIYFRIAKSKIEKIHSDLFKHNQGLQIIGFDENRLVHIDINAFNKLKNLNALWFEKNTCIDSTATSISDTLSILNEIRNKKWLC